MRGASRDSMKSTRRSARPSTANSVSTMHGIRRSANSRRSPFRRISKETTSTYRCPSRLWARSVSAISNWRKFLLIRRRNGSLSSNRRSTARRFSRPIRHRTSAWPSMPTILPAVPSRVYFCRKTLSKRRMRNLRMDRPASYCRRGRKRTDRPNWKLLFMEVTINQ